MHRREQRFNRRNLPLPLAQLLHTGARAVL